MTGRLMVATQLLVSTSTSPKAKQGFYRDRQRLKVPRRRRGEDRQCGGAT